MEGVRSQRISERSENQADVAAPQPIRGVLQRPRLLVTRQGTLINSILLYFMLFIDE